MEVELHAPDRHGTQDEEFRHQKDGISGGVARESIPLARETAPPSLSVQARLQYLQSLYPYGACDDLLNVVLATPDAHTAARAAYAVLNPDVYGLPYLKEQRELCTSRTAAPADRENAFSGITELLEERAADVMRCGHFETLSQLREYNRTVRTFAIDTSAWDAQFLSTDKPFSECSQQHLPLTEEELTRLPSGRSRQNRCYPTELNGAARASNMDVHQRVERRRTLLPISARKDRGIEDDGAGDTEYPTENTSPRVGTAQGEHPTSYDSRSNHASILTGFEDYVEDEASGELAAPIVRWAPKALRVGPGEAEQQQEEMFNIFDSATFFDIPFGISSSPAERTTTPPTPHDAPPAAVVNSGVDGSANTVVAPDRATSREDPLSFGDVNFSDAAAHRPAKRSLTADQTQPSCTTEGAVTGVGDCTSDAGDADSGDSERGASPANDELTPRAAALKKIAKRKQRHEPSTKLQQRVKTRKPLHCVFEQTEESGTQQRPQSGNSEKSAGTRGSGKGPAKTLLNAAANPSEPAQVSDRQVGEVPVTFLGSQEKRDNDERKGVKEVHSPFGEERVEDDVAREGCDGGEEADSSQAEDPFVFMDTEENRWEEVERQLRPYEDIFGTQRACFIVKAVSDYCPLFVQRMNDVARAFLYVASKEFAGRQVADGLAEEAVDYPLFRSKLLSTTAVIVRRLEFDLEKCAVKIDAKDPCFLKGKVRVKHLELEPIHFAYIDQSVAAKQDRAAVEVRKNMDRRKRNLSTRDTTYAKGYTKGVFKVQLKKVSLSFFGTAALFTSGAVVMQVDKASLSIGTLKLSTDVRKLNFLFGIGKPIVKAIITRVIEDAIIGQHYL